MSNADNETKKINHEFPYRQAIGSLMYFMIGTRPDLAYIVGMLSRFMERPQIEHWNAVKRIFRYLKGTTNYGISFGLNTNDANVIGYSDADFAGDIDTRLSTTGWVCFVNSGPVAWSSRKQTITATSTTEAEFIALCAVTKEIIWLRKLLDDLNCKKVKATEIFCDYQRAITITKTPESIKSTKHIEVKYYFTCEKERNKEINVKYVSTDDQLADILTKPLTGCKFKRFNVCYGLC